MARLSIIVCDLCSGFSKEELPYNLMLQKGKGKDKEVSKAEICSNCYLGFIEKLEKDFDINQLPHEQAKVGENKVIADGETIVPSNLNNVTPPPGKKEEEECQHEKASFDPPNNMKCRDCGEEWKA